MLWHKAWLETRSRFAIGLALLFILAVGAVFEYPLASRLISQAGGSVSSSGPLGRVSPTPCGAARLLRLHLVRGTGRT
jgi:hypothetical protein